MKQLITALEAGFNPQIYKIILSKPRIKSNDYQKIVISQIGEFYHLEKFTDTQVFNENLAADQLIEFLGQALRNDYQQYNAWNDQFEYIIQISKKGKASVTRKAITNAPPKVISHNRKKNYILQEGIIIQPLVDMGVFTKEGKVVKTMTDKFRQINRFVEIVDDEVKKLPPGTELNVIDFGCGKSYLTFILYYYLTEIKNIKVRMIGLDLKSDVIDHCNASARKYGYHQLTFELGDIHDYQASFPVDMIITLHACDTATDFALYNAIKWDARLIYSVPCCQHELNGQMETGELSLLTKYGIIKERTAALLTDAIRGNLLEACGYKVQLMEFVDLAHTPKNILIRAQKAKVSEKRKAQALTEVENAMQAFSLTPTLFKLLETEKRINFNKI
ncbi:SAM-dependent methyltransferase [Acetobacterium wieringae]|uniref:class I SAM-dependent methyltransferase n=1 Tax=Acetobacterium wieringae TaxID=52694 RepID=UPI0026EB50B5|nr:SAM-dependent methyltransferase [Acetobacterium wieringae]